MQTKDQTNVKASEPEEITQYSSEPEIRKPLKLLGNIFTDAMRGRELAWRLFLRNIRGMYRQTLLGLFWAFLPPIANTAIWIFLRSQNVFDSGDTAVDPTLFILTGMILWQAFVEAFEMPLKVMSSNRNMIAKLHFPREALLMVGLGEVLFNLAIRMLLLIPAFLWFGVMPGSQVFLFPLAAAGLILVGLSMGLLIMPLGSLYQDVSRFITMALPFWMIITPIIYAPINSWPASLLNFLNPPAPLLILSRDLLLGAPLQHLWPGVVFGIIALLAFIPALFVYRISMPVLIERMSA